MYNQDKGDFPASMQVRKLKYAGFSEEQTVGLDEVVKTLVTRNQFSEFRAKVDSRFDGVETRLDGVETRLDSVETRLNNLQDEFSKFRDKTREQLIRIDARLGSVEAALDKMPTKQDLHRVHLQLLVSLPTMTIIIVGVIITVAQYLATMLN